MNISSNLTRPLVAGRDYPELRGTVKLTLHNCRHHTDDLVIEKHNTVTNALADIFAANYGGLLNYNNFADLYKTWLGGVLVFGNALDTSNPNDYGIPARTSNPVVAHAGQTPLTSQDDDHTRGNPDDAKTVLTAGSSKIGFEWGTSAGNGTISALGLTHTDVGSYGAGVASTAQASLNPFADVGAISRAYTYGDTATTPLAVYNNTAYGFYLVNATTCDVFITPINSTLYKLQGGSLLPITDYTTKMSCTIASCAFSQHGEVYYNFDFTANTLTLWRVPTAGGTTLLQDVINLADGTVTSTSITVTGAKLWKFKRNNDFMIVPSQALIHNGYLYVYGYTTEDRLPNKLYGIELASPANIVEVDTSDFYEFYYPSDFYSGYQLQARRITTSGGILVHNNFLVNGNKTFKLYQSYLNRDEAAAYGNYGGISSPVFGIKQSCNAVAICKLYLATKFNLDAPVVKNATQSMTIEYTLTES